MVSHVENTKRIARNTLMLYARLLFGMLVSLYTSRIILNALGFEDYGIYNVVGGFVAMFSIISGSLSAAVSRFLTFELGRGDMQRLKETFSTSLLIHIALAGIVFILAESIGVWFLNTQMTIPINRLYAANWVFQASVLAFMLGLFSVPFNASITSHEHMSTFAYIGILEVLLRLGIILFIAYAPFGFDKLILYSLLLVAVGMSLQCVYFLYCRRHFEECRDVRLHFNKKYWKEISSFAGWNFIGSSSSLLKDQGVNILLNLFNGPVVNAARGISGSVNAAACSFANNFMVAINPQLTKSYASGDKEYMFSLSERGTRFSIYIILLFALPIMFEADFVLNIWLKHFPEHTVNFMRLVFLLTLCEVLSSTLITIQLATGRVRNYQIAVGGMQLMNFPLSYVCLKLGMQPESTYVVAIVVSLCCLVLRLYFLRGMVNLSVKRYLKNVCANVTCVLALSSVLPLLVHCSMPYGWIRFVVVSLSCVGSVGLITYFIGCDVSERRFILTKAYAFKSRFVK